VLFLCNDNEGSGFEIEMHCVLCAVGTEVLNNSSMNFRVNVNMDHF
jgi:hypothetical protein